MSNYEKYYIYQGYGKPSNIKDRLLTKLGMSFRGLITIIIKTAAYGHSRNDYVSRQHHYVLDNTNWTKINIDTKINLVVANNLEYEHLKLEDYE